MSQDQGGWGIVPRHLRGKVTANEIAVYVALSWRVDEFGDCWPSHKTIAREAGMGERTVQRTLDCLIEKGIITKRGRVSDDGSPTSNIYHLLVWRTA